MFFAGGLFQPFVVRINEDSVSFRLQSCFGGSIKSFNVVHQKDWCFHFSTFSKSVAFLILHQKLFSCKLFELHVTLWRNDGPNYFAEYHKWEAEEDAKWHHVSRSKHSYAHMVKHGYHKPQGKSVVNQSTSGGLIVIWQGNNFDGSVVGSNQHLITLKFTSNTSGQSFHLTNIYGPVIHSEKLAFID